MLYNRIKELAYERGMSVMAIEDSIGCPRGYISKWNRVTPSLRKAKSVADCLGVTLDELVRGVYANDNSECTY